MASFIANIVLKGKLECLTGLHIGGSKEKLEIGGVDSPVIQDPYTKMPYIPGSSLKGKMWALLSFSLGKADQDPNPKKYDSSCPLQRIFGTSAEQRNIGPTRLLIRDAHPDEQTINMWKNLDSELLYTEYKPENHVDRLTSAANPRFIERIVKGSLFDLELVFGIYDVDDVNDSDYFKYIVEALKLLEHSALGKSGSRGYGQVEFKFAEPMLVTKQDYADGTEVFKNSSKPNSHESFKDKFAKRLSNFDSTYISDLLKHLPQKQA
jgi:CRISPR-associated protein Csm3